MYIIGGWLNLYSTGKVYTLDLRTYEWEAVGNTYNAK